MVPVLSATADGACLSGAGAAEAGAGAAVCGVPVFEATANGVSAARAWCEGGGGRKEPRLPFGLHGALDAVHGLLHCTVATERQGHLSPVSRS